MDLQNISRTHVLYQLYQYLSNALACFSKQVFIALSNMYFQVHFELFDKSHTTSTNWMENISRIHVLYVYHLFKGPKTFQASSHYFQQHILPSKHIHLKLSGWRLSQGPILGPISISSRFSLLSTIWTSKYIFDCFEKSHIP